MENIYIKGLEIKLNDYCKNCSCKCENGIIFSKDFGKGYCKDTNTSFQLYSEYYERKKVEWKNS